jgi:cobalt-zinc-cadmium efflux system membrane fusion protein
MSRLNIPLLVAVAFISATLTYALVGTGGHEGAHAREEANDDHGHGDDDHHGDGHDDGAEAEEGRTRIPATVADGSGIVTEAAGPLRIVATVQLTGTVQADPARVSEVRARFPGIVTRVLREVGDAVESGEPLGYIETNESLSTVAIEAPIDGVIVERNVRAGEVSGAGPLFVIVDLDRVWVQLDVFGRDIGVIAPGQQARIMTLDGLEFEGSIVWLSPLAAHASQSVQARVPLANPEGRLRLGQFVRARVVVGETEAPLAVRRSALQRFEGGDVVYVRDGEVYGARQVELGRTGGEFVEVLSGLAPGEEYVVENSYLVKADIEKAGAGHHH